MLTVGRIVAFGDHCFTVAIVEAMVVDVVVGLFAVVVDSDMSDISGTTSVQMCIVR